MSKTQLQTNNTRLASLIDELKGKAAGGGSGSSGGGNVETCTVTFALVDYTSDVPPCIYYMKPDLSIGISEFVADIEDPSKRNTITVLKNSVACIMYDQMNEFSALYIITENGNIEVIENLLGPTNIVKINGDGDLFVAYR